MIWLYGGSTCIYAWNGRCLASNINNGCPLLKTWRMQSGGLTNPNSTAYIYICIHVMQARIYEDSGGDDADAFNCKQPQC